MGTGSLLLRLFIAVLSVLVAQPAGAFLQATTPPHRPKVLRSHSRPCITCRQILVVCQVQPTNTSNDNDTDDDDDPLRPEEEEETKKPQARIKQHSNDQQKVPIRDFYAKQEEAERRVMYRLLLPQRIGKFINTVAIVFILTGILLEVAGYSFVVRDGKLGVDTLEARQFLEEVNRGGSRRDASSSR